MMSCYNHPHRFYAGIDGHARAMPVCVLDAAGTVVLDRHLPGHFATLLQAIAPFRDGLVIGVEGMFGGYWLADRCAEHDVPFVVGHALYMKLIHGARPRTIAWTPTRSPTCSKAATSRCRLPIPRGCVRRATRYAGAGTWCLSEPS